MLLGGLIVQYSTLSLYPPTLSVLSPLRSTSFSFGSSSGVHAEPRALDPSEVPQGRKVTPSWTPIETAHTPQWQKGGERGGGYTDREMKRMSEATEEKQD